MDSGEWLQALLGPGGLLIALIIIVFTGVKQMWVFGWQYQEQKTRCEVTERERDRFLDLAIRGTDAAEAAATLAAERLVNKTVGELTDDEVLQLMKQRRLQ